MFEKRVSLTKDESGQLTGEREKTHPKRNEGETKGEKLAQDPPAPGDMKTPPPSSSKGKHSGDSEHGDHPTPTNTVSVFGTDGLQSSPDTPASTVYTSERETADQAADVSLLPAPERNEKIQANVQEGSEHDESQPLLQELNQANDEEVDEDPFNRSSVREKARMFEKGVSPTKDESRQPTGEREKTLPKIHKGETKDEKLAQDPPAPGDMKTPPPRSSKSKHSGDSEHGDHPTPTNTVPVFGTNGLRSSPDVSLLSSGEQKEKIQANVQEGSKQDESQPLLQEPNRASDEEVDEDPLNFSVCEKARMFEKLVSSWYQMPAQDPPASGDTKTLPEEPPVSSGAVGQNPPMSVEGHRLSTDHNAVQEATIEETQRPSVMTVMILQSLSMTQTHLQGSL
ncbi:uncharacterized protein ACJ7VT_020108 [Polymixia lowei]